MSNKQDIFFKKTINFNYYRNSLKFRVAQDLFSSFQIDAGSQAMLKILGASNRTTDKKILDLGCGYGPIGLSLKILDREREIHMVDRDALAIDYSIQNGKSNKLSNIHVYGSLGYDAIKADDFDLIVSNIPAKAGIAVITYFLEQAYMHLKENGRVGIVVVNKLQKDVDQILNSANFETLTREEFAKHTVYLYQFKPAFTVKKQQFFDRSIFLKNVMPVRLKNAKFEINTTHGLTEFDTLSYESELLIQSLEKIKKKKYDRVIVYNPGQGHIPVYLFKLLQFKQIILVSRDLLSLEVSRYNLIHNGCSENQIISKHQKGLLIGSGDGDDLLIGVIKSKTEEKIAAWLLEQMLGEKGSQRLITMASSSTVISRLELAIKQNNQVKIGYRQKFRGKSIVSFGRR